MYRLSSVPKNGTFPLLPGDTAVVLGHFLMAVTIPSRNHTPAGYEEGGELISGTE